MPTVQKRKKKGLNKAAVKEWVRQFVTLDSELKDIERRKKDLRNRLSEVVEEHGQPDENGHQFFDLGEAVEGYHLLKRECRRTVRLDTEKTMALLEERGLVDAVVSWQPVIDEDALYAQVYEGTVTAEEIEALTTESVNYAFKPVK